MGFLSVRETAEKWHISERVVRQYCSDGRVPGAFRTGNVWNIPDDAEKPGRKPRSRKIPEDLLGRLRFEKNHRIPGGIYHRVQIDLTYNSNHIEGSRLTQEQTRQIFETNTILPAENDDMGRSERKEAGLLFRVDDIIETVNHFRCVDLVIDRAEKPLTESLILQLHRILKTGTSDAAKGWFAVGAYKRLPNEVGGCETAPPERVREEMLALLTDYERLTDPAFEDLLDFHVKFERIHPFQDGNGRVGRLILFKECLRFGITPFIIEDDMKLFYYRGIREWERERGYLRDTCLLGQDRFAAVMERFGLNI